MIINWRKCLFRLFKMDLLIMLERKLKQTFNDTAQRVINARQGINYRNY